LERENKISWLFFLSGNKYFPQTTISKIKILN
jgi:hypothetical protein